MKVGIRILACIVMMVVASGIAVANDFKGAKDAKAVWDITTGDENVFLDRIQLIKETMESLKKRGIKADFVLVIHGPAAKFAAKSLAGTKYEKDKLAKLDQIQSAMHRLKNDGSRIEVCSIAMQRGKIDKENVQPFAVIEDNVFENTIVLQNRGYAYMPVH
ncbi:MAG: DsrE family protein [Nitrospirae bacterium]|nr:DsrE family protein [Nitrospirota bacterium]MCL5236788.1 DsrE family protein [Nitrospirota bacterium]